MSPMLNDVLLSKFDQRENTLTKYCHFSSVLDDTGRERQFKGALEKKLQFMEEKSHAVTNKPILSVIRSSIGTFY